MVSAKPQTAKTPSPVLAPALDMAPAKHEDAYFKRIFKKRYKVTDRGGEIESVRKYAQDVGADIKAKYPNTEVYSRCC